MLAGTSGRPPPRAVQLPVPVISIGNLTFGGTGKTPLVEWVVRELTLLGLRPAVLTRGYKTAPDEVPEKLLGQLAPQCRCDRLAGMIYSYR